jgi:pimeloyl-ACP methyl ester carboxylesterase
MSDDLKEFMLKNNIPKARLIGHSMGGKTILHFGLDHPEMVEKAIVVDISPLAYKENSEATEIREHGQIITALQKLDIRNITSRDQADRLLSESVSSVVVRQFLLKNLKRKHDGGFEWTLNLNALADNMPAILEGVVSEVNTDMVSLPRFPLLFLKGEKSGYIRQNDIEAIKHIFPQAVIKNIPDAGHWVHFEQPVLFIEEVNRFFTQN